MVPNTTNQDVTILFDKALNTLKHVYREWGRGFGQK